VNETVDVAVIGGGIHGCGVAQAAAAAGYSVVLLEQQELAFGSSHRSSKLIHGGLRYLETAQIGLVRESLRERELLLQLAPDLVHREQFFLPIYRETSRRPWIITLGLTAYAALAGFRHRTGFRRLARSEWSQLDGLNGDGLQQVFAYWDAQTDDAQLTRAVMTSARSLGATLVCPAEFISAEADADGYRVQYCAEGEAASLRCRTLVNASGPWVNEVLSRVQAPVSQLPMDLVQGTHIVLPGEVHHGIYYLEAPADRRAVFVMPWHGRTLVGTTETEFQGDPAKVRPLEKEIEYLLDTFRHYFPQRPDEVLDSFAGLRVLPAGTGAAFSRTRETRLHPDHSPRPRLVTIYGGKLTAYRATAQKVMHMLRPTLGPRDALADTTTLKLAPETD
jgi:glycerol-3-phosphate dehydrogenase